MSTMSMNLLKFFKYLWTLQQAYILYRFCDESMRIKNIKCNFIYSKKFFKKHEKKLYGIYDPQLQLNNNTITTHFKSHKRFSHQNTYYSLLSKTI